MITTRSLNIINLLTSVFCIILFFIDNTNLWVYPLASLGLIFLFIIKREDDDLIKNIRIRPIHVFLLSYCIVFFQKPIDYLLGYPVGYFDIVHEQVMRVCMLFSTIGLSFFLLGYSLINRKQLISSQTKPSYSSVSIYSFATSMLLIVLLITIPRSILFGGYNSGNGSDVATFTYILAWINVFISAFFIQLTLNIKAQNISGFSLFEFIKKVGIWQNTNIILNILIVLNIGDRGPVIVLVLAYYISYIMASNKCPSKIFMISTFVGAAIFFSFLGETKSYRGNDNIFERIATTYENVDNSQRESICPQTDELAGSFKCLAFAISAKGTGFDYKYGGYQLNYLLTSIPFISHIIPLAGNSSNEINEIAFGNAERSYGIGTNCLADLYLDFGVFGIILGMLIWGTILKKFEMELSNPSVSNILIYCMAFYFCINVFTIPRSAIFFYMKYAVWLGLIIKINNRK